jgi:hypothetical protein
VIKYRSEVIIVFFLVLYFLAGIIGTIILFRVGKMCFYERVSFVPIDEKPVWITWKAGNFQIGAVCKLFSNNQYWLEVEITRAYGFDNQTGPVMTTRTEFYTVSSDDMRSPIIFDSYNCSGDIWWFILEMNGLEGGKGVELCLKNTRWRQQPIIEY